MTITWLNDNAGDRAAVFDQQVLPRFMREHPDIRIVNHPVPFGELQQQIVATAAAGGGPDVYRTNARWHQELIAKGAALRLEGLLARQKFDRGQIPSSLLRIFADPSGRAYGLPDEVAVWTTILTPALFRQRGIPLPQDSWKSGDLLAAAQALTKRSGGKLVAAGWRNLPDPGAEIFEGFLAANGGRYLSEDLSASEINSPQNVEVLQFWGDLKNTHRVIPSADEWKDLGDESAAFYQGKIAGQLGGAWSIVEIKRHSTAAESFHELPTFSKQGNCLGGGGPAIAPSTRHVEEALTFLLFNLAPETQLEVGRANGPIPCFKNIMAQYLHEMQPPPDDVATMVHAVDYAVTPSAVLAPGKFTRLNEPLQKLLTGAWAANTSIKEALDEVKRQQDVVLQEKA